MSAKAKKKPAPAAETAPASKKKRASVEGKGEKMERNASRMVGFFVLLMFTLHPLMVDLSTPESGSPDIHVGRYGAITAAKLNTYYFLFFAILVLLGLYLVLEMSDRLYKYRPFTGFKDFLSRIRLYEWALIGYLVVLLVSTLLSEDPGTSFTGSGPRSEGFLTMLTYVGAIFVVGRLYRPKERDFLIFAGVATLVCAYGICQYYNADFLGLMPNPYPETARGEPYGPGMIIFSTMSNANVISVYSCIAFILCTVLFSRMQSLWQIAYLPMAWVIFYQLIQGDTQSGYLGLLAAFGLCFALIINGAKALGRLLVLLAGCVGCLWIFNATYWPEWLDPSQNELGGYWPNAYAALQPYLLPVMAVLAVAGALLILLPVKWPVISRKIWLRIWAVVVVVVVVATIIAVPMLAERTGNEILQQVADLLHGEMSDDFATARGFMWKRTMTMFDAKSVLIGHGPDMFAPLFRAEYGAEAAETNGEIPDKAHNEYLQILFDAGALCLLLLLAGFGLILWGARKKLEQPAAVAVFTAMVFYLVQAFFNISTPFSHPIVYVFWGILAALSTHDMKMLPQLKAAKIKEEPA